MKKMLSLMLAALMFITLTLPALAEENTIVPLLPVVDQLGNAALVVPEEDGYVYYINATEDDLYAFLVYSSVFGAYHVDVSDPETPNVKEYYLFVPGTSFEARVLYSADSQQFALVYNQKFYVPNDDMMATYESYLTMDVKLPAGATANTLPQFYHLVGVNPYFSNQIGDISYAFDGQLCWTEFYDGIDWNKMRSYTTFMYAFGFDVSVKLFSADDNGVNNPFLLEYTNGDLEVLVLYDALDQTAEVHYEPGVTLYLLSGDELNAAMGL